MSNKANPWLITIIIVVVVGGGLYYWSSQKQINEKTTIEPPSAEQATESVDVDKDWPTYTSDKGFRISYPSDWQASENAGDNYDSSVVSLRSPATVEKLKNQQIPYSQDINIYYYPSIADEPENKQNNLAATTLNEMIDKNPMVTKIGSIEIGGLSGVDVVWGGYGAYYTILVAKDSQLYKIQFSRFSEKQDMADIEKKILDSLEFTN